MKSEDFDNYTCIASNGLGDERQLVSLKVSGKPDPPVQLVATAATHNSLTLRWQLDFTGGAKLEDIGYRIRQKKAGSENYVYRDVPKVRCDHISGLIRLGHFLIKTGNDHRNGHAFLYFLPLTGLVFPG